RRFSTATAAALGSPTAFVVAVVARLLWAATGPFLRYSHTWQLTINTATTVITFLAVFVIQNTQNRGMLATQLKLHELLRPAAASSTANRVPTRSSRGCARSSSGSAVEPADRAARSRRVDARGRVRTAVAISTGSTRLARRAARPGGEAPRRGAAAARPSS